MLSTVPQREYNDVPVAVFTSRHLLDESKRRRRCELLESKPCLSRGWRPTAYADQHGYGMIGLTGSTYFKNIVVVSAHVRRTERWNVIDWLIFLDDPSCGQHGDIAVTLDYLPNHVHAMI